MDQKILVTKVLLSHESMLFLKDLMTMLGIK